MPWEASIAWLEEYLSEVRGGSDFFALWAEFLASEGLQPALLTVDMPALDGDYRLMVLILAHKTLSKSRNLANAQERHGLFYSCGCCKEIVWLVESLCPMPGIVWWVGVVLTIQIRQCCFCDRLLVPMSQFLFSFSSSSHLSSLSHFPVTCSPVSLLEPPKHR